MIGWRDMPSLAALRAFEAAARCGSLSAAARELNVTHAAVAGHVRALETFFATPLLHRAGQGMETTPDGAMLARGLTEGFTTLAAACRDLSDRHSTRALSVTVTPTFAENWLMPRISSFWAEHPEINVTIAPSTASANLRRDGYDLAIRYGDGEWPGYDVEPLLRDDFVLVAAPALAARLADTSNAALLQQRWLMSDNKAELPHLARGLGVEEDALSVSVFATNGLVLSAVRAGLGLGLQHRVLIQRELDGERLAVLREIDLGETGYYVLTRQGAVSENLRLFRRWLRRAA
ncbi:LysR substrate-binding domain-containing protein [Jannaschia ovalis]|uniref:LysR substrate-binding domain-containing protein n=1 Tax=Jannaschia ovalis TaxID=3038773 RepID=A0ABY8L846_9RHOB|nr:LysR substrate-binding domain-containing protein [Jannaschia sp. GRR-S6-38]WGH77466.1 LysR substrate-binding domain-containing protein [Jannaschia sp. GRR-S6-38]